MASNPPPPTEAPRIPEGLVAQSLLDEPRPPAEAPESAPEVEESTSAGNGAAELNETEPLAIEAAETPPDEPEEDPDSVSEGGESFSSLEDLFRAAELDDSAASALPVRVKVDGQESKVPLSDLVASYQIRSAAEKRLSEAKERARAGDEALAAKNTQIEVQLAQSGKILERLESELQAESSSINWAELRKDDPAEYSARRAEIAERREGIERLKREALETYQSLRSENEKRIIAHHEARLESERAALLEALPEWRDAEKAKEGRSQLVQYLTDQNFDPKEVQNVLDHRLVLLARKAMLYDQARKNGAAKKQAAKPMKILRPGSPNRTPKPKPKSEAEMFYS